MDRGRFDPRTDIGDFLDRHRTQDVLRFITCGSVDDGKSTLIGRLLHDANLLFDDQLAAVQGPDDGSPDFAALVDGLVAEREQGITIDVAYRYFATPRRRFIVADTPGHEQYTRNMVTGASTADLAVILLDARQGVLTQTRRHAFLAHLMGVRQLVLAVNKLDLVDYDRTVFEQIVTDFAAFAAQIGADQVISIPVAGLSGDNVVSNSPAMPWYDGPALLPLLETVPIPALSGAGATFRMPVQWVNRAGADFRGLAGQIASGTVAVGDRISILPSDAQSSVARIVTFDGDLANAVAGQSVTITLSEPVDCGRGDVIAAAASPPGVADRFEATLVWLAEDVLVPGRGYWLKLGPQTVTATVQPPKYEINVNSLEHLAARTLGRNAIGVAEIGTDQPLVFEPYADNRTLGGFILIDKLTNATVGAGLIHFALRRSQNLHWQEVDISREAHAALKGQRPAVLWFTGLSGAGKSTIANLVERKLHALGRHTYLLDGDNVRQGLNRDLGFTEVDRIENIRRVGEVASLMANAGLIVLAAFISPFRAERALVRDMVPADEFVEIHVDTPLQVAEDRDVKGLYRKARAGELANFTGIDSPYEAPERPEVHINTTDVSAEQAADLVVAWLMERDRRDPR